MYKGTFTVNLSIGMLDVCISGMTNLLHCCIVIKKLEKLGDFLTTLYRTFTAYIMLFIMKYCRLNVCEFSRHDNLTIR